MYDALISIYHSLENELILMSETNLAFIVVILIIVLRIRIFFSSVYYESIINIVGNFLHELMHYIVGFILSARPTSLSIIPKRDNGEGYSLGRVGFSKRGPMHPFIARLFILVCSIVIISYLNILNSLEVNYLTSYSDFIHNYMPTIETYQTFFGLSKIPFIVSSLILIVLILNLIIPFNHALNITNTTPIALAPLILFPAVIFNDALKGLYFEILGTNLVTILIFSFLLVVIVINAIPSSNDFKAAFTSYGMIVWIPILLYSIYCIHLDEIIIEELIAKVKIWE